jgi:hypothetical protein
MTVDLIWTGTLTATVPGHDDYATATFTLFLPDDPGPVEIFDAWTAASQLSIPEGIGLPVYVQYRAYIESVQAGSQTIILQLKPSQLRWFVPGVTALTFALVIASAESSFLTTVMGVSFQH